MEQSEYTANNGNVLFYVLIAVALIAALSYSVTQSDRTNVTKQNAYRIAEELYMQTNMIRGTILECILEYPGGGGDLDSDNDIDTADNPNTPYPLDPDTASPPNPAPDAGNSEVRNLTCMTGSGGYQNLFQGAGNEGRFLSPIPDGFAEWTYNNDSNGVYIQTTAPNGSTEALTLLMAKFGTCQADLDYNSCGARCFTAWIERNSCP